MNTPRRPLLVPALLLFALVALPGALHAQATKIFVASTGNDANDGSRGSPKRNFQAAHNAVAAGGQIVVLDTAGYGALSIIKSISITVPPGVNGFVTVGSGNGITVAAGSGDVVALRGLIVEGGGAGGTSSGIFASSVGTLVIEDCTVRNFNEGILVLSSNAAQVSIFDTAMRGCSYGLDIEPVAAVTVVASATRCRVENCGINGALASTNGTGGTVDFTLDGCTVRGCDTGLSATGANALLRASNCTITGSSSLGVLTVAGGQVVSRGNNTLEKNTSGNTFPATYNAK